MAGRNSLTNLEVSIIKNLLARGGYQNQEIAGMINRSRGDASKDISSGRITNIKKNQIQKYVGIAAADDETTNKFLSDYNTPKVIDPDNPLSDANIARLFPLSHQPDHFNITETDLVECKQGNNTPMKTIAAFANNKGGYFALGVENGTWKIVGIPKEKHAKFDFNKLNQEIRSTLGIAIDIKRKVVDFNGKAVVFFHVAEAHTKPVIFIGSKDGAAVGHIYFRYPGEDRLITPADLQKIIENRLRQLSENILSKHISRILKVGPENAAILDLNSGKVEGKSGSFVIDAELLKKITFIREGEFSETLGAPALKVIGELTPTTATSIVTSKLENIRDEDLIESFLNQEKVAHPDVYIKRLKYTQRTWLPVYYFIDIAEITTGEAIGLIAENHDGRKASVSQQIKRLTNGLFPKPIAKKASYKAQLDRIKTGADFEWEKVNIKAARKILYALRHLERTDANGDYLIGLLNTIYKKFFEEAMPNDQSNFIAAIGTVDWLLFSGD